MTNIITNLVAIGALSIPAGLTNTIVVPKSPHRHILFAEEGVTVDRPVWVLETNWVTVARQTPVCDRVGCLVMHTPTAIQNGSAVSNLTLRVTSAGVTNTLVIRSVPADVGPIGQRMVAESFGMSWPYR